MQTLPPIFKAWLAYGLFAPPPIRGCQLAGSSLLVVAKGYLEARPNSTEEEVLFSANHPREQKACHITTDCNFID